MIRNDVKGQTHLRVQGNDGAGATISQVLYGLEGGKTYSASVWVELSGERSATIGVRPFRGYLEEPELPKTKWSVVHVDSEEPAEGEAGGLGRHAIDNDPATIWHSQWAAARPGHPHELQVDLGETVELRGFTYLPRPAQSNGTILDYAFYAGLSPEDWGEPLAKGAFNERKRGSKKFTVEFPETVRARYIRLVALSEIAGQPFTSAAEVGVLAKAQGKEQEAGAFEEVRASVHKTAVRNYSDNSAKYLTNYQRIKVLFDLPEGEDAAELYLQASPGAPGSIADFDDVRVVEATRTPQGDHYFFEDFEHIDEGWGPFIYGFQGSMRVHLAETNEPYTDDTLDGQFSLKSKETSATLNFRSLPALLPLPPNTTFRLSFDYLCDVNEQYSVIVATDEGGDEAEALRAPLPGEKRERQKYTGTFATGAFDDYYLGFVKNQDGDGILSIDNVAIDIVN
jgi:hypothetical protein